MKFIKLTILLILSLNGFSQNLNIENIKIINDSIVFKFSILNNTSKVIKIYTPNKYDLRNSILNISFIDSCKNQFRLMPCNEIEDLDAIILNCKNSLCLQQNEKIIFNIIFTLEDINFLLNESQIYNITAIIDLNDVVFEGETENLNKKTLISQSYYWSPSRLPLGVE